MTKAEALKLAIDGKKVRNTVWPLGEYIYFDYEKAAFITESKKNAGLMMQPNVCWEAYEEPRKYMNFFRASVNATCPIGTILKCEDLHESYSFRLWWTGEAAVLQIGNDSGWKNAIVTFDMIKSEKWYVVGGE